MDHRLRLTVPADHRVEFELPEEITGEVEITVTPISGVPADVRRAAVELSRASRASMPKGTPDSVELVRESRETR